jgi:RNA polymerase sigma-70 factor (ECF subfamily)
MHDKLLDYTRMRVTDTSSAQDIVQDVCLLAWEKIDDVMCSPNPNGWMMNTLKNYIRKYKVRTALEQERIEPLDENIPAPERDLSDSAASFSSVLRPEEMRIVELKAQGYKHREIADILGVKPGTIDSAVSRIKVKITNLLEDKS